MHSSSILQRIKWCTETKTNGNDAKNMPNKIVIWIDKQCLLFRMQVDGSAIAIDHEASSITLFVLMCSSKRNKNYIIHWRMLQVESRSGCVNNHNIHCRMREWMELLVSDFILFICWWEKQNQNINGTTFALGNFTFSVSVFALTHTRPKQ